MASKGMNFMNTEFDYGETTGMVLLSNLFGPRLPFSDE